MRKLKTMFPSFKLRLPAWLQGNQEGPPDLDEVFRDLSNKINRMFGGKGNNSAPSNNGTSEFPLIPIIFLIIGIWMATGFYIVDQRSLGVEQRFGKYTQTTSPGPRWHWPYPIETVTVVNMEEVRKLEVGYETSENDPGVKIKIPKEALMLTEDENIIDMQVAIQYKLKSAEDYVFSNRDPDKAVKSAAETAIREIVGKSKLDDLLQKGLPDTMVHMQAILDSYKSGIQITSVSRQKGAAPEQVKEAFDDVNRANQDYQRKINLGQAYANDVIPKARGDASRIVAEAAGYKQKVENEAAGNASRFEQVLAQYNKAPEVTRQRLYIDAQEQMLSNTSKVIVDQKGGNSMLYLPLDKLMPNASAPAATTAPVQTNTTKNNTEPANSSDQLDQLRSREREGR